MNHAQFRVPEQSAQPPELPVEIQRSYDRIYGETVTRETRQAQNQIIAMLESGEGYLSSIDQRGRDTVFDAGDIWTALTESEEPGDLRILAAIVVSTKPDVLARAHAFLTPLIDEFVQTHAERVAERAAQLHLIAAQ